MLHLDERNPPHVQAHKVPIDPKGKLNAKHYFGGREKMRAVHQTLKKFYGSVEREAELEVEPERLPDPPRVMLTSEAARKYKLSLIEAVLQALKEPVELLRHQAMLTRDEHAHRVEAEKAGGRGRAEGAGEDSRGGAPGGGEVLEASTPG